MDVELSTTAADALSSADAPEVIWIHDDAGQAQQHSEVVWISEAKSSGTAASSGYRADVDGLRAFAVISVILFHFDSSWLPGGFVGVDVRPQPESLCSRLEPSLARPLATCRIVTCAP